MAGGTYLLLFDFVFLSSDDALDADEVVVVDEAGLGVLFLLLFFLFALFLVVARSLLHLLSVVASLLRDLVFLLGRLGCA